MVWFIVTNILAIITFQTLLAYIQDKHAHQLMYFNNVNCLPNQNTIYMFNIIDNLWNGLWCGMNIPLLLISVSMMWSWARTNVKRLPPKVLDAQRNCQFEIITHSEMAVIICRKTITIGIHMAIRILKR